MRLSALCIALCSVWFSQHSHAQDVVRVEEDWELVIAEPEAQLDAPQVSILMFPFGDDTDAFIQLDINHASLPTFSAGGLQVSAVVDEDIIQSSRLHEAESLQTVEETISWTQAILKTQTGIQFGILSAQSETWGDFSGAESAVYLPFDASSSSSLNGYRPEQSLNNSGIPYAGNRVLSLKLKRMRVYGSQGEFKEWIIDSAPGQQ